MYSGAASIFQDTSEFQKLAFTLRNRQYAILNTYCYAKFIAATLEEERHRDGRNRKLWSEHPTEMAMKKQAHKQENV
jgi:hypothetical protein